ncbi:MAG: TolC family protein [Rikenellaceae bacterium]|nr:TolC family protein [Rikenellaceae bacterium]
MMRRNSLIKYILAALSLIMAVGKTDARPSGGIPESTDESIQGYFWERERADSTWNQIPMSLAECLTVGFRQNFDILIERNTARIADNNATRANAGYYPYISFGAGYSGSLNNTKREDTPSYNGIHNYTVTAGPEVAWTLFEGFGIRTTYSRLQELQQIGELSLRLTIEDFIARFATEYYGYIRQYRRLQNLRYAVSLSQERVRIVEAHYQIGSQSRLDLQQANVDLNFDRSQLIKQYETMHNVRTGLNELMALDDIDAPVIAADSVIVFDENLAREDLERGLLHDNTYLEISRKGEDISQLDLKLVKSGRYPYVRVNTGYGYTQNWYGSGGTYNYRWQRNLGLNYGVSVGINIFDGNNQKRRERNARLELENSRLAYRQTENSLKKEFSDAWMAYHNNISLTKLEQDNLETARDNYDIAMERYRLGQLSGIELREAQTSLLDAEERLVQAQFDTKLSEITLLYLSGKIFSYLER